MEEGKRETSGRMDKRRVDECGCLLSRTTQQVDETTLIKLEERTNGWRGREKALADEAKKK